MTKLLTIYDVKRMLEAEHESYNIVSFDYGFMLECKNAEGVQIKYYFNQEGNYIYPDEKNLGTLGKKRHERRE